ncbi:23S RNA-specific pseudouridylate synthase [Belliella baltica DSM 15883]|uniref:23S RNA-specific pseudouridylate synthase n=1 Tax=Belliella baltica (strain DSM 15883 / CIP 108006 / LMG 21964 / BA134) TaxID=866536 RepID=I3Z8X8_BELBD|nr:RluA family pseudouridine synthase [Belliella baltica]AFL85696.1 23S RNA-specific pseudouridylate synthase [Belliella baltica DSM 15883]
MIDRFIPFHKSIAGIEIPTKFTFPFYYQAHPLAIQAANQLQHYLRNQSDWKHNFGIDSTESGLVIGKMFGVLVVQNKRSEFGFLAAFSGKLADSNDHHYFVPPVFDLLKEDGFFKRGEQVVNGINQSIEVLEADQEYVFLKKEMAKMQKKASEEIANKKEDLNAARRLRKQKKKELAHVLTGFEFEKLLAEQIEESLKNKYFFNLLVKEWEESLEVLRSKLHDYEEKLLRLKKERKELSNKLQQQIFDQYRFLNINQDWKSLREIFTEELQLPIPAGAGECAAPKLLHYAFLNDLKPIAMAEFWWGQSPKSEIRRHGEFYPACRSKCLPILGHMLAGMEVDENPLLKNPAEGKKLEVIYEDDFLIVINKPAEFLSVPGKNVTDSVQKRITEKHPEAILVHRLDQSTSGIILVAKNKFTHQQLQAQFIKRTVEKRYVAVLEGKVKEKEGLIDLPLRVDLDNRPQQMVCYKYGKPSQTKFKVLSESDELTRIQFIPITGRTHQLRMHAAHPSGLGASILGDDLYGRKADRLHLHAEFLAFTHPEDNNRMEFEVEADF